MGARNEAHCPSFLIASITAVVDVILFERLALCGNLSKSHAVGPGDPIGEKETESFSRRPGKTARFRGEVSSLATTDSHGNPSVEFCPELWQNR
jgi:hypothetical protein